MTAITNRYDFQMFFTVKNGNPNGDPDVDNMPRVDPETNHGLVTDVCLKRKVRNYFSAAKGNETGFRTYFADKAILNNFHLEAYKAAGVEHVAKKEASDKATAAEITRWMCNQFIDIRTFGAVMSTDVNAGAVQGPIQIHFSESVEPISTIECAITRSSVTNEKDAESVRTMGRKHIVPFALYRVTGSISPMGAAKTGMTEEDLDLFWAALQGMFDIDHSAARGMMSPQDLFIFKHASRLGSAPAHKLHERVSVTRKHSGQNIDLRDAEEMGLPAAREMRDYEINFNDEGLPGGIEVIRPWG
jgi:CRISPR-associated protein Csd2